MKNDPLNPKNIIERHQKYPDATEILIESYAFYQYQKAVKDLMRVAKVVELEDPRTTLIIVSPADFKEWKSYERSHWYLNVKL